jgi:hypothetical protein
LATNNSESYLTRNTRKAIIADFSELNEHFGKANKTKQWFVANKGSAWVLNPKKHTHSREDNAYFIPSSERKPVFDLASDFRKTTEGIIDCVSDYYNPTGVAKAYNLTGTAREIIYNRMMQNTDTPKVMEGRVGRAIISRDSNERKKVVKGNIQLMQPVSRSAVKRLLKKTLSESRTESNERIIYGCFGVLNNSKFEGFDDQMPNRYREATGGRIFGFGLTLQGVKREVKNAALIDQYDHDIVNCHVTFASQLGKRYGVDTSTFDHFIDMKSRECKREYNEYAERFNDDKQAFKDAMLALVYGAWLTDKEGFAVHDLLQDGATDFSNDVDIKDFSRQAKNISAAVLKHSTLRNGTLLNHLGKPLELGNAGANSKTQFAHILHGYEAQMLHYAIEMYGDNISLLSHDGFVTKKPIETLALEKQFAHKTGIEIQMKTTQLAA